MEHEFTFETTKDGKTRGVTITGPSFTLALEQARNRLGCYSVNEVLLIRQRRKEDEGWVTIFDPYRGIY